MVPGHGDVASIYAADYNYEVSRWKREKKGGDCREYPPLRTSFSESSVSLRHILDFWKMTRLRIFPFFVPSFLLLSTQSQVETFKTAFFVFFFWTQTLKQSREWKSKPDVRFSS